MTNLSLYSQIAQYLGKTQKSIVSGQEMAR